MKKQNVLLLLSLMGTMANPAYAETDVVHVNGVAIPQARIDLRIKSLQSQGQKDSPELRKRVREDLINTEAVAQEAVKLGLNKDEEVQQQLELARQSVLVSVFFQSAGKKAVITDDQIKQEYERVNASLDKKEYSVRHILLANEADAKDIIAQLAKNEPFEKLAEKSKDANSAARGGSLGWVMPSAFVPVLGNAIVKLAKGSYTKEPVQSQLGWHVIKVDDERIVVPPPLTDVKSQLHQRLQQQAIQKAISEVRAKAKVE